MDSKKYIASGILELYVAGSLSEKENQEVYDAMQQYPEIKNEVEQIELSIQKLTAAVAPQNKVPFASVKNKMDGSSQVIKLKPSTSRNWITYTGWAASGIFLVGTLWMFNENRELKENLKMVDSKNIELETQISNANQNIAKANELVTILRAKEIESITLGGQAISPDSYAKVFWNKEEKLAYVDVAGLPEPPAGKVYQVWSLKLDPLTPTSMGTLDDFLTDDNKVFTLANVNDSEAFGITLEPAGGSEAPTLDQLYALGVVKKA
tara:strand:- start:479446 stop:480240 length:795 start_codon:yes stop_codon:yes gene_type:complete